jgi:hypothetical protein
MCQARWAFSIQFTRVSKLCTDPIHGASPLQCIQTPSFFSSVSATGYLGRYIECTPSPSDLAELINASESQRMCCGVTKFINRMCDNPPCPGGVIIPPVRKKASILPIR